MKENRIEFYKDEDTQRLIFALYLLVSLAAVGFSSAYVFSSPVKVSLFIVLLVGIWVIVSIAQIILHLKGYRMAVGNMIVMIVVAAILVSLVLVWLSGYIFPVSMV